MGLDRILRMVFNQIGRKAIQKGVQTAARRGEGPDGPKTPEQNKSARETARRANQALRLLRRFGR